MVVYDSAFIYVDSATDLKDELCRINTILKGLKNALAASLSGAMTESYSLDTGQTKVNTKYRTYKEITDALLFFEQRKQITLNDLNKSRVVRLVDGRNFIGPKNYR